ncbi:MAG TPA: hypothetical protein VK154_15025 [Chitinophagales bacterium]|nr:hypothetical protein [Chitinophagales bacterium]
MANKQHKAKVQSPSFLKDNLYGIIVVLFCLLLYANSIPNDYNMDDELVTINHKLTSKGISAIPEIFTSPYYSDESGYAYEYRPFVLATFAIEHSLFGDNPLVSHFFNWILYACCTLLVYILLCNLTGRLSPYICLAITLIFAAHPSHTEVVCSIKNRDEILGLIAGLTALYYALKAARQARLVWLVPAGLFFLISLMCKITFISFAIIIPLMVTFFNKPRLTVFLLLLISLLVPSYFMLDFPSFYNKVFILFAVFSVNVFFYVLADARTILRFVQEGLYTIKSQTAQLLASADSSVALSPHLSRGMFPSNDYLKVSAWIMPVVLFCVYGLGLYLQSKVIIILIISCLSLLYFHKKESISYWALFFLYVCLITGSLSASWYDINNHYKKIMLALLIPVLLYGFFFGRPTLKGPHLFFIFITIAAFACFPSMHFSHSNTIIFILLFCSLYFTKGRYGVLAIGVFSIISLGFQLYSLATSASYNWANNIAPFIRLPWVIAIYLKKGLRYMTGLHVIALLLLIPYLHKPVSSPAIASQINTVGKQLDANIYKVKTDRPLSFIENPFMEAPSTQVRIGTSLRIMLTYLQKVVIPYPLAFYYGYKTIEQTPLTSPLAILSAVLHLLMVIFALAIYKHNKLLSAGIWIYIISASIYSNYFIPPPGIIADRFLLVPSLGYSIVLVVGLLSAWRKLKSDNNLQWSTTPQALKLTFLAILCSYSAVTFSRNFDWENHLTLMRKDITYVNESAQAHNLLALNLMKYSMTLGRVEEQQPLWKEAIVHFKKSLDVYPHTFNVAYDLGRVYSMFNETDSSLYYFKLANTIDPANDFPALKMSLGMLYQQKDQADSALHFFLEYNRLLPGDFEGYDKLGYQYFKMGRKDMALEISKKATINLPADYRSYFNVARSFVELNQIDSAILYLRKAQQLNPNDQNIINSIQTLSARR